MITLLENKLLASIGLILLCVAIFVPSASIFGKGGTGLVAIVLLIKASNRPQPRQVAFLGLAAALCTIIATVRHGAAGLIVGSIVIALSIPIVFSKQLFESQHDCT